MTWTGRALAPVWARGASPQLIALCAVLAVVSLGPRIPLPIDVPGRRFDLRLEDVLLVLLAVPWALSRPRLSADAGKVAIPLGLYLIVALVSTVGNMLAYGLSPLRGAAYLGKDVEYALLFLLATTWIRPATERATLLRWFLVLAVANASWFTIQLIFGFRRELFKITPWFEAYAAPWGFGGLSYGPSLIGEISPLSVGMFMVLAFAVAFVAFVVRALGLRPLLALAGSAVLFTAVLHTHSRVAIIGLLVVAAVVAFVTGRFRRTVGGFAVALVVGVVVLIASGHISLTIDRFGRLPFSLAERFGIAVTAMEATPPMPVLTNSPPPWIPSEVVVPSPQATTSLASPSPASPSPASPSPASPSPASPSPASPSPASPSPAFPSPAAATASPSPTAEPAMVPSAASPVLQGFWTLFGFGKGSPGQVTGIAGELHDHYLRLLVETGALGFATFLTTLLAVATTSLRAARTVGAKDAASSLITLAALAAFAAAALFQDMFLPVLPNELFWIFVGVSTAGTTLARGGRSTPAPSDRKALRPAESDTRPS